MSDDSELLGFYVEDGSEEAFRELVRRRIGLVYGAALRQLGDEHRAQDVVQTVFTDLARKASVLRHRPVLVSWLYTSTHFAAANLMRAELRQRARDQEAHLMHDANSDDTRDADWERLRPILDQELNQLDGLDREAILLRFFCDMPFSRIGPVLRLSEEAARKRVGRGLEKLRTRLVRRGIPSTIEALAAVLASQAAVVAPGGLAATVAGAAMLGTASSSGAFALFTTMNLTKFGIPAFAAIFAIGFSIQETLARHKAEATIAGLQKENETEHRLVTKLESELQGRSAAAHSRPADPTRKERDLPSLAKAPDHDAALDRLIAHSPALQRLYVRQQTVRIDSRYGRLYRLLGLRPDQIAEFERIKADSAESMIDVNVAATTLGVSRTDPSVAALAQQATDEERSRLRDLLGDSDYEREVEYEQTLSLRGLVGALAGNVYYTDAPLSVSQGEQFLQILANNIPRGASGYVVAPLNWDGVLTQAQTVLSPGQFAALRTLREEADLAAQISALIKPVSQGGSPLAQNAPVALSAAPINAP